MQLWVTVERTPLVLEAPEHLDEALAVGVEVALARGTLDAAPPDHGGVEVARERQPPDPPLAVRDELAQVFVVEVAVREVDRQPVVLLHDENGLGVERRPEERHLAVDYWAVPPCAPLRSVRKRICCSSSARTCSRSMRTWFESAGK